MSNNSADRIESYDIQIDLMKSLLIGSNRIRFRYNIKIIPILKNLHLLTIESD